MATTRKRITEQAFETILVDHMFGKSNINLAKEHKCDGDTIDRIITSYNIVKESDWEKAERFVRAGRTLRYLEWSAHRMNKEIPQSIYDAYRETRNGWRTKYPKDSPEQLVIEEPSKEENPLMVLPQNFADKVEGQIIRATDTEKQNEILYFCKILEALAKQNELIEQLMDVVIPKWAGDMKDNINANFDILTKQMKGCEEKLEKVCYNTRKRGC